MNVFVQPPSLHFLLRYFQKNSSKKQGIQAKLERKVVVKWHKLKHEKKYGYQLNYFEEPLSVQRNDKGTGFKMLVQFE